MLPFDEMSRSVLILYFSVRVRQCLLDFFESYDTITHSLSSHALDLCLHTHTGQSHPRQHDHTCPTKAHHSRIYLQQLIPAMISRDQLAADGIANQRGDRDDGEEGTRANADFAHVADLGDEGGGEGDEGAATEAEEGGEDDDGRIGCSGEPEGEDDDACEVSRVSERIWEEGYRKKGAHL